MISIDIQEEATSYDELALLLQEIGRQITSGNTSGFYPTWGTSGEEEAEDEDNA